MLRILSPPPQLQAAARNNDDYQGVDQSEPTVEPADPPARYNGPLVDPPEMPDAIKVETQKGLRCYYGFYVPNAVVDSFDKLEQLVPPVGTLSRDWNEMRKGVILREASVKLGIFSFMRFQPSDELWLDVDDDVAAFASSKRPNQKCLPAEKIKELMGVLGLEGEPKWILAWSY